MKRPVKRRGYQMGGPVDPSSMSRQVMGGIDQGMRMAALANAMSKGDASPKDTPSTGPTIKPESKTDPYNYGSARGGKIKHTAGPRIGKDDGLIPAQKGEYVVRKSAVKKLGTKVLNQVNKGRLPASRGR